jgi:pimeloyl-ACP methyl ester carboxylesterase
MNRVPAILLAVALAWCTCRPADVDASSPPSSVSTHTGDYVILLHGLGRTAISMKRIESRLTEAGYHAINVSYPSTGESIEQLATNCLPRLIQTHVTNAAARVHFVTYSLGGILVRYYLREHALANLGRVVMLCPPNQGSEVADQLKSNILFQAALGPAGQALGTSTQDVPQTLGPANFELGVITGDRSLNPFFSYLVPGPDDGKVAVASAKVAGMQDFLVVHNTHTFIMMNEEVIRQIIAFLQTGKFLKTNPASP